MSTGGEVANALVCKTSIRGFNSRPVLHNFMDSLRSENFCQPAITHNKMGCPRLRVNEALGLKWEDIDTERQTVTTRRGTSQFDRRNENDLIQADFE